MCSVAVQLLKRLLCLSQDRPQINAGACTLESRPGDGPNGSSTLLMNSPHSSTNRAVLAFPPTPAASRCIRALPSDKKLPNDTRCIRPDLR